MSKQSFDLYKDVEYDFILSANVAIKNISYTTLMEIIILLGNEDLLAIYFPKIAVGRVYPKVEYLNDKLYFTFGISLVDMKERPTSTDLIKNIKEFIISLNKNLDSELEDKIKESDIKVDIITENKNSFDSIDKLLVTENSLYFTRGNDIQTFKLTDDGIVEKYLNENLQQTFPFSRLGITRECKTLVTEGYTLTLKEAEINSTTATNKLDNKNNDTDIDISDPDKTKQDLQQNIKDVEEIQDLKDELDDKIDNLMEESKKDIEPFPSTDFTVEPKSCEELGVDILNKELTAEQKAYINTYIGTLEEFVEALKSLYNELDIKDFMISIDDYVKELLTSDNDIDLEIECITESKSKFNTAEKIFDEFLKTANEDKEEDGYTFKLSDLGLTKEDSADFKNLLLQRDEIEDVSYDPQNNTYTVKVTGVENVEKPDDNDSHTINGHEDEEIELVKEAKKQEINEGSEDIEDNEEEPDIDFDDTISLLDIALSEIPTVGVEDWGKDDELLFTADTKVMFENLKNYEEEIPKYYYDNASNDDWSNGIDSYLEEIKGVNLNNGDSDNTYNWNAPLTHDVEFTMYEADDGCYFKGSIHRAGDVRGNYTTEFLLKFNDKDDCLETLFDTCSENCYRQVTVDGVDYTISPHFFNEYVDIWSSETQENYDDVYCDCIERLREIINKRKAEGTIE